MTVDAELTDERAALQRAVRELLADQGSESALRAAIDGSGVNDSLWTRIVGMGVLELAAAGSRQEAGGSWLDLVVVFEELGHALAPAPALPAAVALAVLDRSDGPAAEWSRSIATGSRRVALALTADDDLAPQASGLALDDGAGTVSGELAAVAEAATADAVLVVASSSDGAALCLVPLDAPAARVEPIESLDLTRPVAAVSLSAAAAVRVGDGAAAERALQVARLLAAAEQTGTARRALEEAVSYAKVRHQFGNPIGSYQAVKHACVDMLMRVEGARCLVEAAALAMDSGKAEEVALHLPIAAAYAAEAATFSAKKSLQVHGGIGFTWEHISHLVLRRAEAAAARFGDIEALWDHAASALEAEAAAR